MDPTATSAKCNRVLHRPGFPAFGPNLRDTDNLPPPQHQKSRTDPGKQKTILAAVRVLVIKGRLILQVTLISSAKK